ncbi:MAG: phage integrase SAM-like domain-containing protein [Mucilaginibacter sp.]
MVYFKIILNDKRQKKDSIYPVAVRVTFNRNNTTFNTGIRIKPEQWDVKSLRIKPNHPNAQAYNKTITDFYSRIQNLSYELIHEQDFSFQSLKDRLNTTSPVQKKHCKLIFKDFGDKLVSDMMAINQTGNAIVYQTAINRVMTFSNNTKLKFTDIDYRFLEAFKRQLIKDGMKQNTISNYFRTLRAIYNKAIKEKLIDRATYPFLDITIKSERTAKRAITVDDLIAVSKLGLKPKSRMWHARNYFLISFALRGASFTDLAYLTNENICKGRITYRRRKTGKELSIKLSPYISNLFSLYTNSNTKYLLPVVIGGIEEDSLKAKRLIAQWIKTTNKWLRKITEDCERDCDITTYVARHTWATTAKRLGYSIELIAEAMGHEHGNRITNIYLDTFDQSLIDEVNEKVIQLLQ